MWKAHVKTNLKSINQIISLLEDKISQRCKRQIKVVSQKDNKKKLIILRSILFQLC